MAIIYFSHEPRLRSTGGSLTPTEWKQDELWFSIHANSAKHGRNKVVTLGRGENVSLWREKRWENGDLNTNMATEELMRCLDERFSDQLSWLIIREQTLRVSQQPSPPTWSFMEKVENGKSERESDRNAEFPPDVSVMERPTCALRSNHMIASIILWFCWRESLRSGGKVSGFNSSTLQIVRRRYEVSGAVDVCGTTEIFFFFTDMLNQVWDDTFIFTLSL